MEKNHPHPHSRHQLCEFFYVFSETRPPNEQNIHHTAQQEQPSSIAVSTELSLSTFSPQQPKPKIHHLGSKRNTRKPSKPNNNPSSSFSASSSKKSKSFNFNSKKNNNNDEWGYSTTLKLYDDPWKIKKVLTASDLGKLNRLLLGSEAMENLVVAVFGSNNYNNNNEDELLMVGKTVRVWDVETMSMHRLVLKRWASFKNYVLIGDWNQDFVKRRGLKKGDEIGLHWDSYNNCFNFSVLKRA